MSLDEIRPKGWDKGDAVELLWKEYGKKGNEEGEVPTIYLGDDTTDEDAFIKLERNEKCYPVRIFHGKTEEKIGGHAEYRLNYPEEVLQLIDELISISKKADL